MFCQTSTHPFTIALADGSSGHMGGGGRLGHTVASDDRANHTTVPFVIKEGEGRAVGAGLQPH